MSVPTLRRALPHHTPRRARTVHLRGRHTDLPRPRDLQALSGDAHRGEDVHQDFSSTKQFECNVAAPWWHLREIRNLYLSTRTQHDPIPHARQHPGIP